MNHFKKIILSLVFTGFSLAYAGAYEDFWTALKRDKAWDVSQLLNRGFDPNTVDPKGQPGLIYAIFEESYQAAAVLAGSAKVDLNRLNPAGESPLMMASLKGQVKLVADLIARGADVNKTGWTPLHYAATKGDVPTLRLLLENHAYVDSESPNSTTPLMMAAQYGTPEAVRLLLAEGAQADQKNQQGLAALDFARRGSRPDAIAILGALARQSATAQTEPKPTAQSGQALKSAEPVPLRSSPMGPAASTSAGSVAGSGSPALPPVPTGAAAQTTAPVPAAPVARPSW